MSAGCKPGRHAARCAGCNKRFGVIVPEDAGEPIVTVALDAEVGPDEATVSDSVRKTARREGPVEKLRAVEATVSYAPAEGTRAANAIEPAEPGPYAATRVSVPGFPRRLGGYEIRKELGRGGMGAVYLARQVSLDRNVALKVMKPEWTRNAQFLARFTREAFAAAQLVHHNMVQIYDIGSDRGVHYFTMEFVQGSSLGEVAKREGKLDPRAAASHVLQAARGLKFAHDHGIIHRDIKPDNLMLNAQGIVKVADLGLVKTPEADISPGATPAGAGGLSSRMTVTGVTMGTPLYMAPEQAMDAANVDARADIYSLGCTFYVLVTGQPPFEGKTAQEVMSKHATARVVPPEMMAEGVPKLLSAIITRMVAKKPEDRYQDMGEVVGALEQFLGVESAGQFAPRQEHAALLEECAAAYNDAPAAGLRRRLTVGFAILCTLAAVLSARFGWPLVAAGAVGLGLLTGLFHFAVHGLARKTVLFTKFRQLALGGSLADSAAWVLVGAVFAGVLCLLGLQWAFLVLCAAALALALGLHFLVDRKAGLQRGEPLGQVRELLRDMRLRGLGEDALRQFVCHCGSERWEPLYEALFGYEAKLQARKESGKGEAGRIGKKSGAWRDPIVEWVDARLKARREAREKEHLEAIEAGALEAKGVSESQAVAEARQAAGEMLAQAATMKESVIEAARAAGEMMAASHAPEPRPADGPAAEAPPARPTRSKAMRRRVEAERALDLLLGARTRFILGALLIAACLVWMKQNGMLPGARFKSAIEHRDRGDATGLVEDIARTSKKQRTPLKLPLLSESVAAGFFNSFNPALAGLLLILSTLFPGPRMALFIIPAAAIVMVGHVLVLPSLGPIRREHMSMVIGGALAALGLLCGRERGR